MARQWVRALAARVGVRLPFTEALCATGSKRITFIADGRVRVQVSRTLVFLEPPGLGDLQDVYTAGPGEQVGVIQWQSPDGLEVSREVRSSSRVAVRWRPRESIRRYGLYVHEHEWIPSSSFAGPAVGLEYECDLRTAVFTLELSGTASFETGVVFKRPRWPWLTTERGIVRHALTCLKNGGERPRIAGDGARVEYTIESPQVGDRYMLVAFRKFGIADLEERLVQTSLGSRIGELAAAWVQPVVDRFGPGGSARTGRR